MIALLGGLLTFLVLAGWSSDVAHGAVARPAVPTLLIDRDFPDPSILSTDMADYAYSTSSRYAGRWINVPVAEADTLTGPWVAAGIDALPTLPAWAVAGRDGDVWAPDVTERADGVYLMYFAAPEKDGEQCIGAATSPSPTGPFAPVGDRPVLCDPRDHGAIDPMAYTDDGRHYLVYKDEADGTGDASSLWINEVTPSGVDLIGPRSRLLTADVGGDEERIAEAPFLVRHDGRYVLFYSAGRWNATYHVKYAVSDQLTGPYTRQGTILGTDAGRGAVPDPGGEDLVRTACGDYLFFHGVIGGNGGTVRRGLFATRLDWAHGVPVPTAAG